ncbi:GAF and ANTAR domain-containing protein [Streptomyces sp. SPB162]|uniref:GAF and ANTAR domain-containing protein n=1 Tax=Streptomyces sp. SPB162 TaxID=2940560 RepID=UPI0024070F07|nr:GAF and ANTAR domain-containing protein [Streptomyces sp. SPB162]MDF9815795.1 GAF domain-containing protein [Streptomyces sp. SPB162]
MTQREQSQRERLLTRTFVELADVNRHDLDESDYLHAMATRCEQLLHADCVIVFRAQPAGPLLTPAAVSSPSAAPRQLLRAACTQGPALDTCRTAESLGPTRLVGPTPRWPTFVGLARAAGFRTAATAPLRYHSTVLGSVLFLQASAPPMAPEDIRLGRALADAAASGLYFRHQLHRHTDESVHLRTALVSRTIIEQAKGVLAVQHGTSPDEAFTMLRAHARSHHQRLSELAQLVVETGSLPNGRS